MNMFFEQITWKQEEKKDSIVFTYLHPEGSYYAGKANTMTVTINDHGFTARYRQASEYEKDKLYFLPGDYSLEMISEFLAKIFFQGAGLYGKDVKKSHYFISDAFLETEIWYERGYLANPRSFPAEIFTIIPLEKFTIGIKSYRRWMHEAFFKQPAFKDLNATRLEKMIVANYFPNRIHSIKNWKVLNYNALTRTLRYQAWKHPNWGIFIKQCYALHQNVLERHNEAWAEIDAFIEAAIKFPKTERVRSALDAIYRNGGSVRKTLELRGVRELETYASVTMELSAARKSKVSVLKNYSPPKIPVSTGWLWANKLSFWTLGELYNCCINEGGYDQRLAQGYGAVMYQPEFARGDQGGGGLCFFECNEEKDWYISEIRGWCNRLVEEDLLKEAESMLEKLKIILPKKGK